MSVHGLAVICKIFIILVVLIGFASAQNSCYRQVVVDQSYGDFKTIQAAIDSVPINNSRWFCIQARAGIYSEKLEIDEQKQFIYLRGQGKKTTTVVWSDHDSIVQSATLTVLADNFVARSISFVNSYNLPVLTNTNPRKPAVAAMVLGNSTAFYRCGFYGVQDTLWDFQGTHYYKGCTIVGAVDFIFGSGQTIFERSVIATNALGVITAQGRDSPDEDSGFVFKDCSVIGQGQTQLGRPWRPYARVIFYHSYLASNVVSTGWDSWVAANHENQLTFAEIGCNGMGANQTGRVSWLAKLSDSEVQRLTSLNYIDTDGWISRLPFRIY